MAITINYGPSAAALGSVAFDAGRGIEKRRRQESDREYGLRAQSQAFAMQQAALQEKARRRQEQRLMQQQMFDQQRQRAVFQSGLQQQMFNQQRQIADYNKGMRDLYQRTASQTPGLLGLSEDQVLGRRPGQLSAYNQQMLDLENVRMSRNVLMNSLKELREADSKGRLNAAGKAELARFNSAYTKSMQEVSGFSPREQLQVFDQLRNQADVIAMGPNFTQQQLGPAESFAKQRLFTGEQLGVPGDNSYYYFDSKGEPQAWSGLQGSGTSMSDADLQQLLEGEDSQPSLQSKTQAEGEDAQRTKILDRIYQSSQGGRANLTPQGQAIFDEYQASVLYLQNLKDARDNPTKPLNEAQKAALDSMIADAESRVKENQLDMAQLAKLQSAGAMQSPAPAATPQAPAAATSQNLPTIPYSPRIAAAAFLTNEDVAGADLSEGQMRQLRVAVQYDNLPLPAKERVKQSLRDPKNKDLPPALVAQYAALGKHDIREVAKKAKNSKNSNVFNESIQTSQFMDMRPLSLDEVVKLYVDGGSTGKFLPEAWYDPATGDVGKKQQFLKNMEGKLSPENQTLRDFIKKQQDRQLQGIGPQYVK